MSDHSITIGRLLLPGGESGKQMAWAGEAIDGALSHIPFVGADAVKETLKESIVNVLDISLGDILGAAWNKYHLLKEYRDTKKHPPDETALVPVADHKIESKHKPVISIKVGELPAYRLVLDVDLSLSIDGLILKIRDGKIKEIASGSCKGGGTIKWDKAVLIEKRTRKFNLPGTIDLGDGIVIAKVSGSNSAEPILAGPKR